MTGTQAGVILRHIRGLAGPADLPDRELLERFTAGREGPAFEAMVRRHGPMVLGVCRRVLGNLHDAEDAFQATFLVLARDANSICKRESLGSWLYGVAYRVAAKARGQAAQRRRHEGQVSAVPPTDPLAELTGRELITVLDEELHGLSERYRVPLVLCYFQGLTCDEAARSAGWPLRTFKRRLDQARERLRRRLARRGLALPAALSAAGLAQVAEAAITANLAGATIRAALRSAAEPLPAGAAASLTVGTSGALAGLRFKPAAAALVLACLVTCGAVALAQQATPPPAGRPAEVRKQAALPLSAPQQKPRDGEVKGTGISVSGRVLGSDGKPLAGAEVALIGHWLPSPEHPNHDYGLLAQVKTDAEGRFRLARKDLSADRFYHFYALAGAKGHGLDWRKFPRGVEAPDIELRLEPERVIRGRLRDLQGLPAKGVKGRLVYVSWQEPKLVGRDPLQLRMQKQRMQAEMELRRAQGRGVVPFRRSDGFEFELPKAPEGLAFWPRSFTTDAQGRFEVRGLAAGQDAHLLFEDERFALQELLVETDPKGPPAEVPLTLAPPQRIEGRVVYADSGKPAAGAHLNLFAVRDFVGKDVSVRTDAQGRFAINPYVGTSYVIRAWAPSGEPYVGTVKRFEWPKGAARHTVEIVLPRGVELRGKVSEAASGKPLGWVRVVHVPRQDNETAQTQELLVGPEWPARTAADGSYRLVVPAGPGHVLVDGDDLDFIRQRVSRDEIQTGKPGGRPAFHNAVLALNPELKEGAKALDIPLRRGVTLRGTVLDPDGKRVSNGTILCPGELAPPDTTGGAFFFSGGATLPRGMSFTHGRFELRGCDPARTYRVFVLDVVGGSIEYSPLEGAGRLRMSKALSGNFLAKAAAVVEVSAAKAKGGELTVRLQPPGSAQLKLRDAAGKPSRIVPFVELEVTPDRGPVQGERAAVTEGGGPVVVGFKTAMTPDAEGRLTIRGLVPGATYRLLAYDFRAQTVVPLGEAFTVESGKTRKLPDVVAPQLPAAP
jgi:RNA polymerase sigma factor (sigma-70 family)